MKKKKKNQKLKLLVLDQSHFGLIEKDDEDDKIFVATIWARYSPTGGPGNGPFVVVVGEHTSRIEALTDVRSMVSGDVQKTFLTARQIAQHLGWL